MILNFVAAGVKWGTPTTLIRIINIHCMRRTGAVPFIKLQVRPQGPMKVLPKVVSGTPMLNGKPVPPLTSVLMPVFLITDWNSFWTGGQKIQKIYCINYHYQGLPVILLKPRPSTLPKCQIREWILKLSVAATLPKTLVLRSA